MNEKNKFALNFDLIQEKIEEEKQFDSPLQAYVELGNELTELGFTKRQQSSWISKETLKDYEVINTLKKLTKNLSWLKRCVNHFTATAESAVLDLNPYFYEEQTKQDFINFENERGVTHLVCSNKTTSLVYGIIKV